MFYENIDYNYNAGRVFWAHGIEITVNFPAQYSDIVSWHYCVMTVILPSQPYCTLYCCHYEELLKVDVFTYIIHTVLYKDEVNVKCVCCCCFLQTSSIKYAGNIININDQTFTAYKGPAFTDREAYCTGDTSTLNNVGGSVSSIIITGEDAWTIYRYSMKEQVYIPVFHPF